jgi:hypothetical protein
MIDTTGKFILHTVDQLIGVVLTIAADDDPHTLRSKIMQAAPIPDTRDLIRTESKLDPSMRKLAIESEVDQTLGVDAVSVNYAFFYEGSWVYLHRFIFLNEFTSPRELLNMLKRMIPDFSAEEAERKSNAPF